MTNYPDSKNWAPLGTDLAVYIYLPASPDATISGDLRASFLINDLGGPPTGLVPGMWTRVEWPDAPLGRISKLELKISTSSMVYAGPLYVDSLMVSRSQIIETEIPIRRFPTFRR